MGSEQELAHGPGGGLAAVALGAAVLLPIVMVFVYAVTELRSAWPMILAVAASAALVATGVRASAGGDA